MSVQSCCKNIVSNQVCYNFHTSKLMELQYFGPLMRRVDSLEKDPDAGRDWGQEEKGMTEDEMAGEYH